MAGSGLGRLRFWGFRLCRLRAGNFVLFGDEFALSAFSLDFGPRGGAEGMGGYGEFASEVTVAEDFDAGIESGAVCQPGGSHRCCIHESTVIKTVESVQIHRQIARRVTGIVKAAFRNSPN